MYHGRNVRNGIIGKRKRTLKAYLITYNEGLKPEWRYGMVASLVLFLADNGISPKQ